MRIALIGYGKMGKEIEKIAIDRNHTIVGKYDINNCEELTPENLSKADVAIEFSTPHTVIDNIYKCFTAQIPVVVGTTGWHDQFEEVKTRCNQKNGGLFWTSNYSIGANIFFEINKKLARLMNNQTDYDVNIEEIHHIHKLDKPSGTGITLANGIIENLDRKNAWKLDNSEVTSDVIINSVREGEVPGTHIIRYLSNIDKIEIKHEAFGRKGLALGAVVSAEWMVGKVGIFEMSDLLKLNN